MNSYQINLHRLPTDKMLKAGDFTALLLVLHAHLILVLEKALREDCVSNPMLVYDFLELLDERVISYFSLAPFDQQIPPACWDWALKDISRHHPCFLPLVAVLLIDGCYLYEMPVIVGKQLGQTKKVLRENVVSDFQKVVNIFEYTVNSILRRFLSKYPSSFIYQYRKRVLIARAKKQLKLFRDNAWLHCEKYIWTFGLDNYREKLEDCLDKLVLECCQQISNLAYQLKGFSKKSGLVEPSFDQIVTLLKADYHNIRLKYNDQKILW